MSLEGALIQHNFRVSAIVSCRNKDIDNKENIETSSCVVANLLFTCPTTLREISVTASIEVFVLYVIRRSVNISKYRYFEQPEK